MKHFISLIILIISLVIGSISIATPDLAKRRATGMHWTGMQPTKADGDTIVLVGSMEEGAPVNGQFEDAAGEPSWNEWTTIDLTARQENTWHAAPFNAVAGNFSAWCGDLSYPACDSTDVAGGYGNNYNDILEWRVTVADNSAPCAVSIDAFLNHDLEDEYDYLRLQRLSHGQPAKVLAWYTGFGEDIHFQAGFTVQPQEFTGPDRDQVVVQFVVTSDGFYSDQDCDYSGVGACQVDEISMTANNGNITTFDDFEDGTLGSWAQGTSVGVGDFAQIWEGLIDADPCRGNTSPQVAFIDDGVVVPGTGGSPCISWCYGPAGYIVNTTGGLAGSDAILNCAVRSPVMAWPDPSYDGILVELDVYIHETWGQNSPGMMYAVKIRSTESTDPTDIENEVFRPGWYYPGLPQDPFFRRHSLPLEDSLVPGRRFVQLQLEVSEAGAYYGRTGNDGYPAPYFDNVRVTAFPFHGPSLESPNLASLPRDGFPPGGVVDYGNLGANSVRFDGDDDDLIYAKVVPLRVGASVVGMPQMHYKLQANPLFDPYRTSGLDNHGFVHGKQVFSEAGDTLHNYFSFDLPDTGFFFPGDALHVYLLAQDEAGGVIQTAFLPADTTGFSNFDDLLAYPFPATVRALPTVSERPAEPGAYDVPPILFINHWGSIGQVEWFGALRNLGLRPGVDYDHLNNRPGDLATVLHLDEYRIILMSYGVIDGSLMTDADISLLSDWLSLGGKNLLLTGDSVVQGLADKGGLAVPFLEDWLGAQAVSGDIGHLIGNQVAPVAAPLAGDPVFATGERIAGFHDPNGTPGYSYAAAILNQHPTNGSRVITLPFDFDAIHDDPSTGPAPQGLAARTRLLRDVLYFFGLPAGAAPSEVPDHGRFFARSYPNPFNPTVRIEFNLPHARHVSLKVYDVRGRQVRDLLDETRPAGPGWTVWDGTDESGARVASGTYFYSLKAGSEEVVRKIALIK
jgi:hypothetical protein